MFMLMFRVIVAVLWTLPGLSTSSFKEQSQVLQGRLTDAAQHWMCLFCGFVVSHHLWSVTIQMSFLRVIRPHLCICSWFILLICSHRAASFSCLSKSIFMKRLPAMHSYSQDHNWTSQPLQFCQCLTQSIAMCDKWQKCGTLVPHCIACCNWQIIIIFNHKNCLQSAFSESVSHINQFVSLTCLYVIWKIGFVAKISDGSGQIIWWLRQRISAGNLHWYLQEWDGGQKSRHYPTDIVLRVSSSITLQLLLPLPTEVGPGVTICKCTTIF